jgi:uroporphyrinogen decarboxylase
MNKRERVLAALRGDAVDRPPVSFWGHDFLREWSAEDLAAAMLDQVRTYDYDYLKVNPRATYYTEAWGCTFTRPTDPNRHPEPKTWVLHKANDLDAIKPIDGTAGSFAEQLDALRLIGSGLGGEVPFIQTVFSPLSVVGRLADGREPVLRWMTEAPGALHAALDAVTESLAAYARASIDAGADGIFFATTEWATFDVLDWAGYETFGKQYDLRVLGAVAGAPLNVLHVCRPSNMLERLLDYPYAAVNWAVHAPKNLTLVDAMSKTDRAVMGGVDERHVLLAGSADDVRVQVAEALQSTGGRRFLLAPGCSIEPRTPPKNLRAAVAAVKEAAK